MSTINAVLLRDVPVQVRDLSTGGCLLETKAFLSVGTVGILDMQLDGVRRVDWFRICRIHATHGRSGAYLVAAEFLPVAAAGDHTLRGAVGRMGLGEARGVPGLAGRLSGDPGNLPAISAATPDARPDGSALNVVEFRRRSARGGIGNPVAESAFSDSPNSGKSDEGESGT